MLRSSWCPRIALKLSGCAVNRLGGGATAPAPRPRPSRALTCPHVPSRLSRAAFTSFAAVLAPTRPRGAVALPVQDQAGVPGGHHAQGARADSRPRVADTRGRPLQPRGRQAGVKTPPPCAHPRSGVLRVASRALDPPLSLAGPNSLLRVHWPDAAPTTARLCRRRRRRSRRRSRRRGKAAASHPRRRAQQVATPAAVEAAAPAAAAGLRRSHPRRRHRARRMRRRSR